MEIFSSENWQKTATLTKEPLGENILRNSVTCRVWIPEEKIIVLGRSQEAEKELNISLVQKDKIPVFKRLGGGGTVFLDESSTCFSIKFFRNKSKNIDDYLSLGCQKIIDFLASDFNLMVDKKGLFDLTIHNKKFLGSSLYMSKEVVLYYAVILYSFKSMPLIEKYLKFPSKSPDYRKKRSHRDFLTSLEEHLVYTQELFNEKLLSSLSKK